MAFWCKGKKGYCLDVENNVCNICKYRDDSGGIELDEAYVDDIFIGQWISVKKQPEPAEVGEYLCYGYWFGSGRKKTETAEYLGEWKIVNNFILTHWMPLPEPPKEDER